MERSVREPSGLDAPVGPDRAGARPDRSLAAPGGEGLESRRLLVVGLL